MQNVESGGITPDEFIKDYENSLNQYQEEKYDFQVGLKDLDFDVDIERIELLGLAIPFMSITQAEQALTENAIIPKTLIEFDNTEHQVIVFDYKAVGYSGFMDCVTHSLTITDQGLFEVGRYPAISMSEPNRYWQWFLHRRLVTPEEVMRWQEDNSYSSNELVDRVYAALTGV
jgi:hypothetical protein